MCIRDRSSLPLGINQIKIQRSLTTSNVAVFVPFVTQELFQSGAAMYYGCLLYTSWQFFV